MESFNEICSKMLRQFEKLLRHDPCVFGRHQLIQIMAINMYQIEVAKQIRTSGRKEDRIFSPIDFCFLFKLILSFVHNTKNRRYNSRWTCSQFWLRKRRAFSNDIWKIDRRTIAMKILRFLTAGWNEFFRRWKFSRTGWLVTSTHLYLCPINCRQSSDHIRMFSSHWQTLLTEWEPSIELKFRFIQLYKVKNLIFPIYTNDTSTEELILNELFKFLHFDMKIIRKLFLWIIVEDQMQAGQSFSSMNKSRKMSVEILVENMLKVHS